MFCSECGSSNRDSARFCQSCGTVIDESQQAKVVANVETEVSNEKVGIKAGYLVSSKWLLALTALSIAVGVSIALIFNSSDSQVVTTAQHLYTLGETGPGGGTVFYYSAVGFNCGQFDTATGSPTGGLCHYLEAAPSGWSGGADPKSVWALSDDLSTAVPGITFESSPNNSSAAIGLGLKNSLAIVALSREQNDATTAAGAARAYTGGSKSDWYLPDIAELNQLCKYASGQPWRSDATICTGSEPLSLGLGADNYWSSSELDGGNLWYQHFRPGYVGDQFEGVPNYYVRPVRAF